MATLRELSEEYRMSAARLSLRIAELEAASGKGYIPTLFMVNEELPGLNAQPRSLTPRRRISVRRVANGDYPLDRRQFEMWTRRVDGEAPRPDLQTAKRCGPGSGAIIIKLLEK